MSIAAGALRHRVAFKALVPASDGQGGTGKSYPATTFTVWGQVEYLTGRELIEAQQIVAEATVRILMRFRADLAATMRAVWVNKGVTHTFEVQAYRPADAQNEGMYVYCAEVQA